MGGQQEEVHPLGASAPPCSPGSYAAACCATVGRILVKETLGNIISGPQLFFAYSPIILIMIAFMIKNRKIEKLH